jgi:hypothetical protein
MYARPSRSQSADSSRPAPVQRQPQGKKADEGDRPSSYDFSQVDLFSHAPQRAPVQLKLRGENAPNLGQVQRQLDPDSLQRLASHTTGCCCPHCGGIQRKPTIASPSLSDTGNLIQRDPFATHYTVTIKDQQVRVKNKAEEKNATRIINKIETDYGIKLDSKSGIAALKDNYKQVPKTVTDQLATDVWHHKELVALETAMAHYAPILGGNRANSALAGKDQEVTVFSKLAKSIKEDVPHATKLSETDYGEYFADQKTVALFGLGTSFFARKFTGKLSELVGATDFDKLADQVEGTIIHEMAHGIFKGDEKHFTNESNFSSAMEDESPIELIKIAGQKLFDPSFLAEMQSKVSGATKAELDNVQLEVATRIGEGNYEAGITGAKDAVKDKMKLPNTDKAALQRELFLINQIDSALRLQATQQIAQLPSAQGEISPAYWDTSGKKTNHKQAEKPMTSYGETNPAEDLCETAMFYFKQLDQLRDKAPQRYSIFDKLANQKGIGK